jgi:lipopolysaccharide/colanic/teichoic acid biosynthesis glycosyltransferase
MRTATARALKRGIDVAGALALLVATSPLLLVAAIAIRRTMGSPVLFRQARTGRGGRTFTLLKLRTMTNAGAGDLSRDAQRLTPLGRFLRATSVDELPQLWNVLRGDMSLVGPRPLLPSYLPRYSPAQARRHEVLPGLTGLAQVNGRNALSWEEKFALDVRYVDTWSLALDLSILRQTVVTLVRGRGVSADGHVTMPEFLGTKSMGGAR